MATYLSTYKIIILCFEVSFSLLQDFPIESTGKDSHSLGGEPCKVPETTSIFLLFNFQLPICTSSYFVSSTTKLIKFDSKINGPLQV